MADKQPRSRKAPSKKAPRAAAKKRRAVEPEPSVAAEPVARALFIFQGVVLALGAATFAEVPVDDDTIVVRVDDIFSGPEILRDYIGQPVTVRLTPPQHVDVDDECVFHTDGWIFGAGLAVQCLSVEPAHAANVAQLQADLAEAPTHAVRARAARADLVVAGQVSQIKEVPRDPSQPITEHDPIWQDAVIRVHDTAGTRDKAPKEVVVRFAASRDVKWAKAPKFNVGGRGVWMLGGEAAPHVAAMRSAMDLPKDHFLVVDPDDFYPEDHAQQVMERVGSAGSKP